jgi:hypothetical protein
MSTRPPPPPSLPEQEEPHPPQPEYRAGRKSLADYEPPPGYVPYGPRKRKPGRAISGLYLPLWSVLLMLLIVFGIGGSIIFAVIYLGGPRAVTGGEPQILIVTAVIMPTSLPSQRIQATPAPDLAQPAQPDAIPLPLEGPTLEPTITPTPTPLTIAVDGRVQVVSSGGVRVRAGPGLNQNQVFLAQPGDTFTVIGGPQIIDVLTWWQVRDADNRTGWAAQSDGTQELLRAIP